MTDQSAERELAMPYRRLAATVAVATLAGLGLAACGDDDEDVALDEDTEIVDDTTDETTEDEDEDAAGGTTEAGADDTEAVLADPESFVGEEITLSGEVQDVYTGTDAFRLDVTAGAGMVDVDEQTLFVFSADQAVGELESGQVVQVVGTLQEWDPDMVAQELGIDQLPDDLGARIVPGDFIIVADTVAEQAAT